MSLVAVKWKLYEVIVMDQIICSVAIVIRRRYRDGVNAEFDELRCAAKERRRRIKCLRARPAKMIAIVDNKMGGIQTIKMPATEK